MLYVAGNLLGTKLGTTSVVGGLRTTSVLATCAGLLVSTCTGLGARGVTVGTASVLPGTAAVVLLVFTASRTACTMLGTSWVVKGRVTGCSAEEWSAEDDWVNSSCEG